jgi:EAL domain-containing protein (putative c-di-GMP-specific phosphodiesterase class I)
MPHVVATESKVPSGGTRVLVVEDEDALRSAIARYLTRAGHRVAEARNGHEAMTALDQGGADVVLSDITMPGMDGLHLLRAVRERDLDLPVILATGAPTVASAAAAVEHGALAYLIKPVDLATLEASVRRAGALYGIARAKRAAFALLGSESTSAGDRAGLESSFDRTLDKLWIAFQPIVSAHTRAIFGYEALMRSEERSLPHPGAVLDAAERLGRLTQLGRVLRSRTVEAFARAEPGASLFVNLHPEDLSDDSLFDDASALCPLAARVVLEITERSSLGHVRDVRARIARLRQMGFRVAIDDLGAGYAGLSSFADLEPEIVKLDMSLVRDVDKTPTKQKLVRSMTSLCHDLGIDVVTEGVETREERDCLIDLGTDHLQGYLFAKPGRPFPNWSWTP